MLASILQSTIIFESTGLVVLQWFDRVALTIVQPEMLRRPGKHRNTFKTKLNAGCG